MRRSVLCIGPAGAGKTEAIHTLCPGDVTEVPFLDSLRLRDDPEAAQSIDVGVRQQGTDTLVIYGSRSLIQFCGPAQITHPGLEGLIVLLDHSKLDSLTGLSRMLDELREYGEYKYLPLVIGVTHTDLAGQRPIDIYSRHMRDCAPDFGGEIVPVLRANLRDRRMALNLLQVLQPMMEFTARFPPRLASKTPARHKVEMESAKNS